MSEDYSKQALLGFLDYAADKGLMKRGTAAARKAAVNNVLAILDPEEGQDLRNLDIDGVFDRFATLHSSRYSPQSLREYRVRARNALLDFLRFREDPANFRIGSSQRTVSKKKVAPPPPTQPAATKPMSEPQDRLLFNIPIPIRAGVLVHLNGVPADISKAEATRISKVVLALASTMEDAE